MGQWGHEVQQLSMLLYREKINSLLPDLDLAVHEDVLTLKDFEQIWHPYGRL